jgi:hypothetical protein
MARRLLLLAGSVIMGFVLLVILFRAAYYSDSSGTRRGLESIPEVTVISEEFDEDITLEGYRPTVNIEGKGLMELHINYDTGETWVLQVGDCSSINPNTLYIKSPSYRKPLAELVKSYDDIYSQSMVDGWCYPVTSN